LPILAVELDLEEFYRDHVIGGPGAFVIPAATFETFADAVLKKLVIEISDAEGAKVLPPPVLHGERERARRHARSSHGNSKRD
jgi:hypothetical protein